MNDYISDIYVCPKCKAHHEAYEWTEATQNDSEGPVMPLQIADDYTVYLYTCPSCWEVIEIHSLLRPNKVTV